MDVTAKEQNKKPEVYDNSTEKPFRIFKKRKTESFYDVCEDWQLEDITLLTGVKEMKPKNLNKA